MLIRVKVERRGTVLVSANDSCEALAKAKKMPIDLIKWEDKFFVTGETRSVTDKKTTELCPHCEHETVLLSKFVVQKCMLCGKDILPCSMCENKPCKNCPFDEEKEGK